MSLFVCLFVLAPRPPNADFRLLSSKELSEAEKETSAKPVCTVISLNTSGIRFISGTSILQTTEVSLNGNNHYYCLKYPSDIAFQLKLV